MKRLLASLGLSFLLAACSVSVTVPLPEQRVTLAAVGDTLGRVVYPAKPMEFPGVPVKGVEVSGVLEANQPLTLTLNLYARLTNPASDPNCIALSDFTTVYAYACPVGPDDEKVGSASFTLSQSSPLALNGQNLTQGVQAGKLWLGVEVNQGLPAGPVDFTFKNLKATVTVGL
ncbi:hypothetical protein [Thermus amyloliquefaciens]|uniref:hypothetical protein n=1 Tax=Thermus amyloliquefaciens TaxID=1449080 RepID=UPI00056F062B|nr:hypothetical protein [Thermus amyloliquefaciens]